MNGNVLARMGSVNLRPTTIKFNYLLRLSANSAAEVLASSVASGLHPYLAVLTQRFSDFAPLR